MNLWNRFKYRLFVWLMGDICSHSGCDTCKFADDNNKIHCWMNESHYQARKVWRVE